MCHDLHIRVALALSELRLVESGVQDSFQLQILLRCE